MRIKCPDGSFKFLLVFRQPLYDRNGEMLGVYYIPIDITDQKEDHTKQEVLSAIVDYPDDAIINWNAGAERIFGYPEAEALGKSIKMLIP